MEFSRPGTTRVETGVGQGVTISPFYDPMIAKLICHADTRREAALGLAHIVADSEIWPVRTNASFLHALLVNPDFIKGEVSTGFIEQHHEDVVFAVVPPEWLLTLAARQLVNQALPTSSGFRLNAKERTEVRLMDRGESFTADMAARVSYDQEHYPLLTTADGVIYATMQGTTWRFAAARFEGLGGADASDGVILSPMPGRIIAVAVEAGQAVTKGQKLLTLEAMKMEHSLVAPFDGTVAELDASEGRQVSEGALLAKIEKADG